MFHKISQAMFSMLFIIMLIIPLLATNLKEDVISVEENRKLAPMAELYNEDGTLNTNFTSDFETWIDDNIGFRSELVAISKKIMYSIFDILSGDRYVGPNGEFNYATPAMIADYQHINLYSEEYLKEYADSLQYISNYVENKGVQFYYCQCWDKHSIYPEYFPKTVLQYGDISKTDAMMDALEKYSTVNVISLKQELIDEKARYQTYSKWGDASHWSTRGAYIAYVRVMESLNANSRIQYKILQENEYDLTKIDQGRVIKGVYVEDFVESFEIKKPQAILTNEKLTLDSEDPRHRYYTNDNVDNNTRVLIIGDSYFDSFIIDDFAESFHETIMIWGNFCGDIQTIIDEYDADIVIVEAAERVDRSSGIINGANAMKENTR